MESHTTSLHNNKRSRDMQVSGVEIGGVVDREFPTTRIGGS